MKHQFRRITCSNCTTNVDVPVYCGNRFCPICSITRNLRVRKRITWLLSQQVKFPGYRYQMWTFSMKNCKELSKWVDRDGKLQDGGIQILQKCFRKLRSSAVWKSKVAGGCFVIEVKGVPGNWHPHIHALIYCDFIKWSRMFTAWRKASGGRGCHFKDLHEDQAVRYITKYLTKGDVPDNLELEISDGLKGIRLFAPIGLWHSLSKSYKKPATACKCCGGTKWFCWDFELGNFNAYHVKDFVTACPKPETARPATPKPVPMRL